MSSCNDAPSSESLPLKPSLCGGRGLFAPVSFQAGDVVYKELSLLCLQDAESRLAGTPVCARCLRPVGGLATQVKGLLDPCMGAGALAADDVALLEGASSAAGSATGREVPCEQACGEVYCSEECLRSAQAYHSHLCTGARGRRHVKKALRAFCQHAAEKEVPHFSLIAMLFASMTHAVCERGRQPGAQALEGALGELELVAWSSCSAVPETTAARRKTLERAALLLSDIFVTQETVQKFPAGNTDDLFNADLLDGLVGMLDRCVVDADFENPCHAQLEALVGGVDGSNLPTNGSTPSQEGDKKPKVKRRKKMLKRRTAPEAPLEHDDDEAPLKEEAKKRGEDDSAAAMLSPALVAAVRAATARAEAAAAEAGAAKKATARQELLPVVRGFSLVRGVALCNHSCAPNVEVEWISRAELTARARTNIAAGEEVLMSYLGAEELQELSLEERRERLQEGWGFLCRCSRCEAEAVAGAKTVNTPAAADPDSIVDSDLSWIKKRGKKRQCEVEKR